MREKSSAFCHYGARHGVMIPADATRIALARSDSAASSKLGRLVRAGVNAALHPTTGEPALLSRHAIFHPDRQIAGDFSKVASVPTFARAPARVNR